MSEKVSTHSIKSLEKYLENREYLKVIQSIGTQYETTKEHFLVVQSYLGLGRYDQAEKLLIKWQSKLLNSDDWANWCFFYAIGLYGMRNKADALTTLNFADDFVKNAIDPTLKTKIETLKKKIHEDLT